MNECDHCTKRSAPQDRLVGLRRDRPKARKMKYMATYDVMETIRNTNEWMGASAKALASYPAFAMWPNPAMEVLRGWGEVTERSFARMVAKPD